ncbi:MAG: right-handed parallel beta-helix repeat-containing protein [Prevotellaceae bacterium]|jgi:hypothetical protein|nr:right-handed parallel beta-helix repeat-containing protein [Prevotellaceae bacterium]
MNLKLILTSALMFVMLQANFARNYYAAPNGTGNGQSIDTPCSIASGISKSDVDTLFLRGGQYNLTSTLTFNTTGTAVSRKAIMAYADEKPVLDFRAQAYGSRGVRFYGNYLHAKGITICYTGKNGFYVEASNSIFENCETYGNGDTGFQTKNCSGNLIKNCDSHHNFDYQTGSITNPDFGGNADGFADKQYTNNGEPNVFDGCRAWANADDGWDFYQKVGSSSIKNSICYQNGPAKYDMSEHPRLQTDHVWFNQFPITIGSTTITLENYKNYGNGNGFKLGGDGTAHNITLTNCLSVGNRVKGFDQNNNNGTMTVYNCSGYGNNPDYGFNNGSNGVLTIKNCLTLASKSSNKFSSRTVTNQYNSWNISGLTCTAADFVSLDTTVLMSARQVSGDLPVLDLMKLVESSDLIDAGVDVGLPFNGAAPDLGCYESIFSTTAIDNVGAVDLKIIRTNKKIVVQDADIRQIAIFDLAGKEIACADGNSISIAQINKGICLLKIKTLDNNFISKKLLID